jgi:hypothetical protein
MDRVISQPKETSAMRKLLASAGLICGLYASAAGAQSRCRVMDPTGTPLNVRTAPSGAIVGTLPNGLLVSIGDQSVDQNGKAWVYISRHSDGATLGWVFREFLACF